MPDKPDEPLSRPGLLLAAGLAVVLVLGVVVVGLLLGSDDEEPAADDAPSTTTPAPVTGPLAVVAVPAPDAGTPACTGLVGALPDNLTSKGAKLKRLPLADPAPPATAAWAGDRGEPVVLRCGLGKPAELTPTAQLQVVSAVDWLPVSGDGARTFYTVNRGVYVALTIPEGTGTGPLQEISQTVSATLPKAGEP